MTSKSNNNLTSHYLFVYGTLKKNCKGHHLLYRAKFIDYAVTSDKYALFLDEYPLVVKQRKVSKIHGEVYLIDENLLRLIDEYEEHPFEYKREKIPVFLKGQKKRITAWIYFYREEKGKLITSGEF